METIIRATSDGYIYHECKTPLGKALLPRIKLTKANENLSITIKRIPSDDFERIVSFLLWSQDEYGQEAYIHGYYNPEPKKGSPYWIFEPTHQKPNGMTVGANTEFLEENNARMAEFATQGYELRMTAHHHCKAGAGQSGTDKIDEHSKPSGYHITFGNMDQQKLSFHHRIVIRAGALFDADQRKIAEPGVFQIDQNLNPNDMIEMAQEKNAFRMPWMRKELMMAYYTHPHRVEFPEEWKEFVHVTPSGANSKEVDVKRVGQVGKKRIVAFFNAYANLTPEQKAEGFKGNNEPMVPLPWGNVTKSQRRPIYDALHRIYDHFVDARKAGRFTDAGAVPINVIMADYIASASKMNTYPQFSNGVTFHHGAVSRGSLGLRDHIEKKGKVKDEIELSILHQEHHFHMESVQEFSLRVKSIYRMLNIPYPDRLYHESAYEGKTAATGNELVYNSWPESGYEL